MTKRILAALTALTLCIGVTGCGKTEEDSAASSGSSADSSASAQEDSSEAETSEEDSDSSEEEKSDDEEKSDEDEKTSAASFEIDPDNIVFTTYDINDMPTNEEAAKFISLALEQYQAAYDGDAQRYFDLINYYPLIEPLGDFAEAIMMSDDFDEYEMPAKHNALYSGMISMLFLAGSEHMDDFEWHYDKEDYVRRVRSAVDSIDMNSEEVQEELGYFFDGIQELKPWSGSDENTFAWMEIDGCDREGDDLYITFDMGVLKGKYNYVIDEVCGWYVDGQWGIAIGDAMLDDNPCEGMTIEEIREMAAEEEKKQKEEQKLQAEDDKTKSANGFAKTLYNYMAEYAADQFVEGRDPIEEIENNFDLLTSDKGLDLGAGEPSATGDKWLYGELIKYCTDEGVFRLELSGSNFDDLDFITYYTAPDGTQGQYPNR